MSKKIKISIILNILIIIFELIGIIKSFNYNKFEMFYYYTECSNILALFSSSLYLVDLLLNKNNIKLVSAFKYLSTLALMITFLVVLFILVPLAGFSNLIFYFTGGAMLYHHLLCPVIAFISLLYFDKIEVNVKFTKYILYFTLLYAFVLIILNIFKIVDGPYPFLRVYNQSIVISIMWFILIIGMTYILSILFNKLLTRKRKNE